MSRSLTDPAWPSWLREIDALLAVHPQFVLSGNVRDRYLLPAEEMPLADTIASALAAALRRAGIHTLLVHDIVDGYRVETYGGSPDPDAGSEAADEGHGGHDESAAWDDVRAAVGVDLRSERADDLDRLAQVVRALARGGERPIGLLLDYAGQLAGRASSLEHDEHVFFSACLKLSHEALHGRPPGDTSRTLYNPIFWVVEREHDLPAWLTARNRGIRAIPVPWPELVERQQLADMLTGAEAGLDDRGAAGQIAARTDGMPAASLFDISTLFADQQIDPADAEDAVRVYTLGVAESPWRSTALADRLRNRDIEQTLSSRILGQDAAVTKAADILRRSVIGLSGAQASSSSTRPRGVLFFGGPTGVGKTELAKALTALVFGTQDAYVRFDMSEFGAEHAGDRLVGAPPGYVGFEGGGELTEAVRRKPHSLLLFDEIEKAHPRILDKFLQLLDDGRLTDGRGTTVHFSDTLVVFTSNLGMTRPAHDGMGGRVPTVTPDDPYSVIERRVTEEIRRHFTEVINRPELLNRVGDNLVVFDFIRGPVGVEITRLMLGNIVERVWESAGIDVEVSPNAYEQIVGLTTADLSFGGRGIGNVLESRLVNPLARALFEWDPSHGNRVQVTEVGTGPVPEVVLASLPDTAAGAPPSGP